MLDTQKVYRQVGSKFEPRWFPVFMYLYEKGPTAVKDIAQGLGVTHPAVTQIANELTSNGMLATYRDTKDRRKRVLAITAQGKQVYVETEPLWRQLDRVMHDLTQAAGLDLKTLIDRLENPQIGTSTKSFLDRFLEGEINRAQSNIEIIDFTPAYAQAFSDLNRRWIEEFFEVVEADERQLNSPEESIIYPGGAVIFAKDQRTDQVLGTAALINHHDGTGELVKMAVDGPAQGRKIGRMLAEAIIERARVRGMKELYLETNSQLIPAMNLYQRLGFEAVELDPDSDFSRADVRMRMLLK